MRSKRDSDRQWIELGRRDPYLTSVTTLDPYKLRHQPQPTEDAYFASGRDYVADLFASIERHVAPGFRPGVGVDFGCSVGRVALALAARCQSLIGLDVSPDVLVAAERNAARFGVSNARWLPSDDDLGRLPGAIDLFHSYNVLQHLPTERGLHIVRRALDRLNPGGVLAVHVPYADRGSRLRRAINWAQAHLEGVHLLANLARRRPADYPLMLMNQYDLAALFALLHQRGCSDLHCTLVDQQRYPGAIVMARIPLR